MDLILLHLYSLAELTPVQAAEMPSPCMFKLEVTSQHCVRRYILWMLACEPHRAILKRALVYLLLHTLLAASHKHFHGSVYPPSMTRLAPVTRR